MKNNDLIEVKFYDFLVEDDLPSASNEDCESSQSDVQCSDIRHSDVRYYEFLSDCTKRLDTVPEVIYFSSTAEVFLLFDVNTKRFIEELQLLYPNTAIEIVCELCVSAYAVITEFYRSNYRSALAFFIETPADQNGLSAFGLAQGDTGFKVKEGVACLCLEKSNPNVISNDSLLITGCSLLSKAKGPDGMSRFLVAITQQLKRLCLNNSSRIVSFGTLGQLSEQIEKGLNILLPDELHSDKWLESIEDIRGHLYSIKPITDLKRYGKDIGRTGLTILCIGFGGRFGIVKFSRITDIDENNISFDTEANCEEFDYKNNIGFYRSIADEYKRTNDMKLLISENFKLFSMTNSCNYCKWKIK